MLIFGKCTSLTSLTFIKREPTFGRLQVQPWQNLRCRLNSSATKNKHPTHSTLNKKCVVCKTCIHWEIIWQKVATFTIFFARQFRCQKQLGLWALEVYMDFVFLITGCCGSIQWLIVVERQRWCAFSKNATFTKQVIIDNSAANWQFGDYELCMNSKCRELFHSSTCHNGYHKLYNFSENAIDICNSIWASFRENVIVLYVRSVLMRAKENTIFKTRIDKHIFDRVWQTGMLMQLNYIWHCLYISIIHKSI